MTDRDLIPIRRALVSVYDKAGLLELAAVLAEQGVEIVSTGSTAKLIADAGHPVTEVSQLTGFPESLDGRVKTLHPAVHAGLLADLRLDAHAEQLAGLGIAPFELVVSNLYPFSETVASGAEPDAVVEQIDIGGPSMVRGAAKNHANVAIVTSPEQYSELVEALRTGGTTLEQRRRPRVDLPDDERVHQQPDRHHQHDRQREPHPGPVALLRQEPHDDAVQQILARDDGPPDEVTGQCQGQQGREAAQEDLREKLHGGILPRAGPESR